MELKMELGDRSYTIHIKPNILKSLETILSPIIKGKRIYIITDDNVAPIYLDDVAKQFGNYAVYTYIIPNGEKSKSMENFRLILEDMASNGIQRNDMLIALGGGVVGDLSGFVAASYMRGIPWVQIPTTLLSQIDSSVGGKVAVNIPQGKNLVGAFYQPNCVLIDSETLKTLPDENVLDGMGELVKYAFISDLPIYDKLCDLKRVEDVLNHIDDLIYMSCSAKKAFVEEDELDLGLRKILNYGHTLGHAIEGHFNYKYTHGIAVANGMYMITEKAEKSGLTKAGVTEKLFQMLKGYDLLRTYDLTVDNMLPFIKRDKKTGSDSIDLILIDEIKKPYIKSMTFDEVEKLLRG